MYSVYLADTFDPERATALSGEGFDVIQGSPVKAIVHPEAQHCQVLAISTKSRITRAIIESWPGLKMIIRGGSGMDNIDLEAARDNGIVCLNTPEGNRDSVAEHALGLMLALLHRFAAFQDVQKGIWQPYQNRPNELRSKTVGIIGYGHTGSTLANLLMPFGVKVLAYDKYVQGFGHTHVHESNWDEIYAAADIVSLHVPLTTETEGLININNYNRFQKKIWLINTSRGEVVQTEAIMKALGEGTWSGAGLDVAEKETAFEGSALHRYVQSLPANFPLIITPHIAGKSVESQLRIAQLMVSKIVAWRSNILSN